MKPYYQDEWVTQYCSDALSVLKELDDESVDLLCTDPPYGISFMGKDWDKALPDINIWKECLRVLKPGAFAFVMSIPRSDCLSRMIISLEDAGFRVDFTPIYWTYASGFPKAQNIGKAVDKRLGVESETEIRNIAYPDSGCWGIPNKKSTGECKNPTSYNPKAEKINAGGGTRIHKVATSPQAKSLDGSYGGFQPKPAVEVIIVCMKPLSEKTFVDQALKNQKGITWLDDCRIPGNKPECKNIPRKSWREMEGRSDIPESTPQVYNTEQGRFPANLICSDDVLNDGKVRHRAGNVGNTVKENTHNWVGDKYVERIIPNDSGSFSRYFDLDKWANTLPFLIVPKASKSEKNKGLEGVYWLDGEQINAKLYYSLRKENEKLPSNQKHKIAQGNIHSTVKPFKLMSYLITLGSREGDTVLDPFGGSGTTALASKNLGRKCIISEVNEKYCEIAAKRCSQSVMNLTI